MSTEHMRSLLAIFESSTNESASAGGSLTAKMLSELPHLNGDFKQLGWLLAEDQASVYYEGESLAKLFYEGLDIPPLNTPEGVEAYLQSLVEEDGESAEFEEDGGGMWQDFVRRNQQ